MSFVLRKVAALAKKELKDLPKNPNVFAICLLPVLFAFILSNMATHAPSDHMDKAQILMIVLNMNLVMVCTFAMSMLIAEEKEKNTLRTLLLSSVSPLEFLAGKTVVILLFTFITNTAIYFIVGFQPAYLALYTLLSFVVGFIMLIMGGIIGLLAENQMATGVIGMPIIMGFLLVPMLSEFNQTLRSVAALLPTHHIQQILSVVLRGGSIQGVYANIWPIVAWIFIAAGLFSYTYTRKGLDK